MTHTVNMYKLREARRHLPDTRWVVKRADSSRTDGPRWYFSIRSGWVEDYKQHTRFCSQDEARNAVVHLEISPIPCILTEQEEEESLNEARTLRQEEVKRHDYKMCLIWFLILINYGATIFGLHYFGLAYIEWSDMPWWAVLPPAVAGVVTGIYALAANSPKDQKL
jgi:hypothetical protein